MQLQTERLYIRPIQIEDKYSLFEYRSDAIANKYQGWIPTRVQDVEVFIGKIAVEINIPDTWFQFVIILKSTNTLIGDLGVHFLGNDNCQVELGFTLSKQFQGKGYAHEAVKGVIDFLFHALKKHRIIASVDPQNNKSIHLVSRLGFRKEAHFKKSLFVNGEWVDDVVFALLASEWPIA